MASERDITFESFDGLMLQGTMRDADTQPRATALLVHGIQSYRDEFGFYSDMANYLAAVGVASFRFDYRCNGVDEARGISQLTLAGVANDIRSASQVIDRTEGLQDIPRIFIATSFGGGISARLASDPTTNVSALILLAPVINYVKDYLVSTNLWQEDHVSQAAADQINREEVLTTNGRPFNRAMINELPYFSAYPAPYCPIWLAHGDADTSEPLSMSEEYATLVENCELFVVPGAEHGFAEPGDEDLTSPVTKRNHYLVYREMVNFLRRQAILPEEK